MLIHSPTKFSDASEFMAWIQTHADAQLAETLTHETQTFTTGFQHLMEQYSDMRGCYDMLKISGNLGQFFPEVLVAMAQAETLNSRESQKEFVRSGATALFRLMNRGVSGQAQNVFQGSADGLPMPFTDSASMEQDFVLPMAEQVLEQCSVILGL